MDAGSLVTLRRKRNSKIKTFFKGLKCTKLDKSISRSFESTPGDEITLDGEAGEPGAKSVLTFSEGVQTVGIATEAVATQTAGDYKRILPQYSVEYFKKIVESNSELHRRDVLIETRRLALTRVVGIVSLKISFHLSRFTHGAELKRVDGILRLSFVPSPRNRFRAFAGLLELKLRKTAEISAKFLLREARGATPRDVLRFDLSCLYLCKVVGVAFLLRKSSYLNLLCRRCPRGRYRPRPFAPIKDVVHPLDFFLSHSCNFKM